MPGLNDLTIVESDFHEGSQEAVFAFIAGRKVLARLIVGFGDDGSIEKVLLEGDGLSGSDLKRFAWSRWLAAATAYYEVQGLPESADDVFDAWDESLPKRPGPKGHPDGFLEVFAVQYLAQVRADPWASPVPELARKRDVAESTVKGWRKKCQAAGLLPKGRPGRPPKRKD